MLKIIALAGAAAVLVIGSIAVAQDTSPTMNNNQGSTATTPAATDNSGQTASDPNAATPSATQNTADTSATAGERG